LRRALDVERSSDLEESPFVIERMQFSRIEEAAAFTVALECIVVPTIPKALHDFEILVGDLVAQCMVRMLAAVVLRRPFERRCHDVPSRPAAADQIERCELPRHRERMAVRSGERAGETDLRRRCRERR
jgi:hypothetical protein